MRVNPESPVPLYYQIYQELRREILSGRLKPGEPLPSEAQICAQCGVSRMTARLALSQLVNEGLVVRKRGKGTFVASPKATFREEAFFFLRYTDLVRFLGFAASSKVLGKSIAEPSDEVREALRLEPEEKVVCIVRLRLIDEQPMALETSFLPSRFFSRLVDMDLTDKSLYQVLEEEFSLAPAYAIDTVELSTAGPYEAKELQIKEGMPIVLSTRVAYSAQDVPLVFTKTIHRGDRFRAVVRCSRKDLEAFK